MPTGPERRWRFPCRERVIRIFPNRDSALRLLGALLLEQDEAWTTGHRYFDMASYWQWRASQEQEAPLPHTA
jgi:putative transposase